MRITALAEPDSAPERTAVVAMCTMPGVLDFPSWQRTAAVLTLPWCALYMPSSTAQTRAAFLRPLNQAMDAFSINTRRRQSYFLGYVAHETLDLRYLQEPWGPDAAQQRFEPPTTLAKALGNTEPGDGKKYLGRGIIQITGRANYKKFGDALALDLIGRPELAAYPEVAAIMAAMSWKLTGMNELADRDDLREITRRITGGVSGLDARSQAVARAKQAFGATVR